VPAYGLVLILIGLWLILRTVRKTVPTKHGNAGLVQLILG
jgi:hypothetical protein